VVERVIRSETHETDQRSAARSCHRRQLGVRQCELQYPTDNPFAGNPSGYREEIYAYGFRNPWRLSFDSMTGSFWAEMQVKIGSRRSISLRAPGITVGTLWKGRSATLPGQDATKLHSASALSVQSHFWLCCFRRFRPEGRRCQNLLAPTCTEITARVEYGASLTLGRPSINRELANTGSHITSFGLDQTQELYLFASDGTTYRRQRSAAYRGSRRPKKQSHAHNLSALQS
jgi:hypothetical protein